MTNGWKRTDDGYELDSAAEITDNGRGLGPAKSSGRWAVTVGGQWIANIDTLAEAKRRALEEVERLAGSAYVENAGYMNASQLEGAISELERARALSGLSRIGESRLAVLRLAVDQLEIEHRIQSVVDEARTAIVGRLENPEHRRQAVTILAHAFGFEIEDRTGRALAEAAAELGVDLSALELDRGV